jgi:hypothetical protein
VWEQAFNAKPGAAVWQRHHGTTRSSAVVRAAVGTGMRLTVSDLR